MICHPCHACGGDLTRVRARREPHYGLPLVTCPACGERVVRRRHPAVRRLRAARGTGLAVALLLAQAAALAFFIASACGLASSVAAVIAEHPADAAGELTRGPLPIVIVPFALALGAWLTAGLGHWRLSAAWLAFAAIAAFVASLDVMVLPALAGLGARAGAWGPTAPLLPDVWLTRLIALAVLMCLTLAGAPLGRLIAAAAASARRRMRSRLRRRLRRSAPA